MNRRYSHCYGYSDKGNYRDPRCDFGYDYRDDRGWENNQSYEQECWYEENQPKKEKEQKLIEWFKIFVEMKKQFNDGIFKYLELLDLRLELDRQDFDIAKQRLEWKFEELEERARGQPEEHVNAISTRWEYEYGDEETENKEESEAEPEPTAPQSHSLRRGDFSEPVSDFDSDFESDEEEWEDPVVQIHIATSESATSPPVQVYDTESFQQCKEEEAKEHPEPPKPFAKEAEFWDKMHWVNSLDEELEDFLGLDIGISDGSVVGDYGDITWDGLERMFDSNVDLNTTKSGEIGDGVNKEVECCETTLEDFEELFDLGTKPVVTKVEKEVEAKEELMPEKEIGKESDGEFCLELKIGTKPKFKDNTDEEYVNLDDFMDEESSGEGYEKYKYGGVVVYYRPWKDVSIMRETKEWHDAWAKTRNELIVSNYEFLYDDLICRCVGRCYILREATRVFHFLSFSFIFVLFAYLVFSF